MRVSRRLIACTAIAMAASLFPRPAANASLNKGLCTSDPTRGAIPPDFFVDACFDGTTLQLHNQSKIVLHVNARGAVGPITRTEPDLGLTAAATRLKSSDPWVLLPDDTLQIPIGSGAARVSVQQALHDDEVYGLGKALEGAVPVGKAAKGAQAVTKLGKAANKTAEVAGTINTWAALINELASDYDQYSTCLAGANWLTQLGCRAYVARNVGFAYGRFGAKVGIAAVDVLLSEVEFIAFVHTKVENAQQLKKSTGSIMLRAVAAATPRPIGPPVVPAQPTSRPTASRPTAGSPFSSKCQVAWPTAPTHTSQGIVMTMSCDAVDENTYQFTQVTYNNTAFQITPSTGAVLVTGHVVDVAHSDYGFDELLVQADSITK